MKSKFLSLTLVALSITACTGPIIMGTDAAIMYVTKPGEPPPADMALQMPQHESWCYKTMADIQCYSQAQDVAPGRLVNVDPPHLYPVDLPSYQERIHPPQLVMMSEPPVVISQTPIIQQNLPVVVQPVSPQKPVVKKPVKKKHHRMRKTTLDAVPNPPALTLPDKVTP